MAWISSVKLCASVGIVVVFLASQVISVRAKQHKLRHKPIGRGAPGEIQGGLVTEVKASSTHAERTGFACEGSTLRISCGSGLVIKIKRANYGRLSMQVCNDQKDPNYQNDCRSNRAVKVITRKCDNKSSCQIAASNAQFEGEDPCNDTFKYVEVVYTCSLAVTTIKTTTKGPTTTIPTTPVLTTKKTTVKPTTKATTPTPVPSTKETTFPQETTQPTTVTERTTRRQRPGERKYCRQRRQRGIEWPRTPPGITVQKQCPNNKEGMALWTCGKDMRWKGRPNVTLCVSSEIKDIEKKFERQEIPAEDLAKNIAVVSRRMKLEGDDMQATTKLMRRVLRRMKRQNNIQTDRVKRRRTARNVTEALVQTGSNMLSDQKTNTWKNLDEDEREQTATSIITSLESSAFEMAELLDKPQVVVSVNVNIVLEVDVVDTSKPQVEDVRFPKNDNDEIGRKTSNRIVIPGKAIKEKGLKGLAKLVFMTYKHLNELLKPQRDDPINKEVAAKPLPGVAHQSSMSPDQEKLIDEVNEIQTIVNSEIISASINGRSEHVNLVEPMTYTLEHLNTSSSLENATCSFWNYSEQTYSGHWSTQGCWMVSHNKTHTTCQCNHLTNFAVLMDVMGTKLPDHHTYPLKVLTIIGCAISIVCLLLSFITFVYFKNLQCDRNTIHKNLVFCLFAGELLFLVGIDKTGNPVACSVIAGFLHYIFLAAFAWMCLEGIQLYVMLIEVFEAEKSRRVYYYLSAYGIPAIIVGIAAAVDYKSYGTETFCWLRADNGFIWAFVGPVIGVITINIVMLSIAIYMMCKHAQSMASMKTKEKSRMQNISNNPDSKESYEQDSTDIRLVLSWIKGALVLIVLLGLTWAFGLLYINAHTVAMAYLFTILNTLQGLFIFVFHCLMNEKVQKEYKRCVRHASWLPMCFRVNYGGYKVYAGSQSPPQSTSSANNHGEHAGHGVFSTLTRLHYLQKLLSGRRRKRSSTTTLPKTSSATQWHYHNMKPEDKRLSRSSRSSDRQPELTKLSDSTLEKKEREVQDENGQVLVTIANSRAELDKSDPNLSVVDASVIDTEFVSEYCRAGMGDHLRSAEEQNIEQIQKDDTLPLTSRDERFDPPEKKEFFEAESSDEENDPLVTNGALGDNEQNIKANLLNSEEDLDKAGDKSIGASDDDGIHDSLLNNLNKYILTPSEGSGKALNVTSVSQEVIAGSTCSSASTLEAAGRAASQQSLPSVTSDNSTGLRNASSDQVVFQSVSTADKGGGGAEC